MGTFSVLFLIYCSSCLSLPAPFKLRPSTSLPTVLPNSRCVPTFFLHFFSFGTIRMHICTLMSRCESVSIAFILPTSSLPSPFTFTTCASQEKSFESLRQGRYTGLRPVINLLPTCVFERYQGTICLFTYNYCALFYFRCHCAFSSVLSGLPISFRNSSGVSGLPAQSYANISSETVRSLSLTPLRLLHHAINMYLE